MYETINIIFFKKEQFTLISCYLILKLKFELAEALIKTQSNKFLRIANFLLIWLFTIVLVIGNIILVLKYSAV